MGLMDKVERAVRLKKSIQKGTYPTAKGELKYGGPGTPKIINGGPPADAVSKPRGVSADVKARNDRFQQQRKLEKDAGKVRR